MYYHIIPIAKINPQKSTFIYHSAQELSIGDIVNINLGATKYLGLIYRQAYQQEIKFKIKDITTPIKGLFLDQQQINLMENVAEKLHLSLATTLFILMPKLTIKKLLISTLYKTKKLDLIKRNYRQFYINYHFYEDKLKYYQKIIGNCSGQSLIIVPDIISQDNIYQYLKKGNAKLEIIKLSAQTKSSQQTEYWRDIHNGQIKVVIGTRKSVFFPFNNLQNIIFDQAANNNHRQWDQNPRFDSSILVDSLAATHGSNLYFVDCFFNLSCYQQILQQKKYYQLQSANQRGNIEVHSGDELNKISDLLQRLNKKDKIIVLFNQLNKRQLFCTKCQISLDNETCHYCNSTSLQRVNSIYELWQQAVKDKYDGLDAYLFSANNKSINTNKSIIFATVAILPYLPQMQWTRLIIADFTSWQNHLDLDRQFYLRYILNYLLAFKKPLDIFTSEKGNPLLLVNDQQKFIKQQLLLAKNNNLFPYHNIIKIIIKAKTKITLLKKTDLLIKFLSSYILVDELYKTTISHDHNQLYHSLILTDYHNHDINKFIQCKISGVYWELNPYQVISNK